MKVILYKRHAASGYHIHAFSSADCLFVPDKGAVLYREQHGSFGGKSYSVTFEQHMLDEAKLVASGKPVEGREITNVRTLDLRDFDIEDLIDQCKRVSSLEDQIRSKMDDIFGGPRG